MTHIKTDYLSLEDGRRLAYQHLPGRHPEVLFLGGFSSNMEGTKALALQEFCGMHGIAFTRFDYTGHGQSSGEFEDGTLSNWLEDALTIIDKVTEGELLLVGSSMGGWIATLAALQRSERIAGLLGIASAPDFIEELIWRPLAPEQRQQLEQGETLRLPRDEADEEDTIVTPALVEDARQHLVLQNEIAINCPIRLLHGLCDETIPWQTSLRLLERITSSNITLSLIKDGDHRLSSDLHLARIIEEVALMHTDLATWEEDEDVS